MKTLALRARVFLLAFVLVTYGCSNNSIEKDAKKVADLQCRAQKLIKNATEDISVLEESQKIIQEAYALEKELKDKYKSDTEKEKFARALAKELENCK
jgi:CRISPR/Cas system CMR subunit Cmr4 (Cas7 group RAMP superfamily)